MQKKKILAVTTGRADFGILTPLLTRLSSNVVIDLHIAVTGSHLYHSHGYTLTEVKKHNFKHIEIIDICQKKDKEHDICMSISKGQAIFSQLYQKMNPDLLLVLGDRYELWACCIPAVIHKIPIAHIHGGEATFGQIDDPVRHSITKMAQIHFASIDEYGKRIIQMGENPENVFVVGAMGLDNIKQISLMPVNELSKITGVNFEKDVALLTYHPVTLDDYSMAIRQITEVMDAILSIECFTIISMSNTDPAGKSIYNKITDYASRYPEKIKLIKNAGQRVYLSSMKHSKIMIGNSSSGIIESASFKLPVVNIGDRQAGRFKPQNVIDCECKTDMIIQAVNRALSENFKQSISNLINPYGDGCSANRIVNILESLDIKNKTKYLKKGFYSIKFPNIEKS